MKHLMLTLALFASVGFADISKPSHDEEMAKMMKLSSPSENHAIFKDLVGNWKVQSKFWMEKNAKPEESKGTQTNKLVMDGRFLQSEHKGTSMGKPFTGMGLLGYDNVRGEYQSIWIDNMSTSIMTSTGSYDASTKTLSETGTYSCPMTGEKNKTARSEWKFTDKKNYTFTMYTNDKDGNEFKNLEIEYKKN